MANRRRRCRWEKKKEFEDSWLYGAVCLFDRFLHATSLDLSKAKAKELRPFVLGSMSLALKVSNAEEVLDRGAKEVVLRMGSSKEDEWPSW